LQIFVRLTSFDNYLCESGAAAQKDGPPPRNG
jgi:hypothetical protein